MYVDAEDNDPGRDLSFELYTALAFHQAGADVSMGVPSDVVAYFGEQRLLIECKRPKSQPAMRRRILEAYCQFSEHRRRGETAVGIVSLDMTVLVNPEFGVLVAESEGEATELLHGHVERTLVAARHELTRAARNARVDAQVDALMMRVKCITGRADGTGISIADVSRIQPLVPIGSPRFNVLYAALQHLAGFEHGVFHFVRIAN